MRLWIPILSSPFYASYPVLWRTNGCARPLRGVAAESTPYVSTWLCSAAVPSSDKWRRQFGHGRSMSASPEGKGSGGRVAEAPRVMGATQRRFPQMYARFERLARSRLGVFAQGAWARRRPIALGLIVGAFGVQYVVARREAYVRDYLHPDTYLVWKVHDGSVVEARRPPSVSQLFAPSAPGDEPPRVLELHEVLHALKWAQRDERVRGLVADGILVVEDTDGGLSAYRVE